LTCTFCSNTLTKPLYEGKGKSFRIRSVENIVQEIAQEIGVDNYRYLYSTREFKKVRIQYFSPAFEAWEKEVIASNN